MSAPLAVAANYARRGWPVLPVHWPVAGGCSCRDPQCASPGKHPLVRHGLHDATTDAEVIRGWLRRWPEANVAVGTGVAFDVADVDDAGRLPPEVLSEMMGAAGPMVLTGSGGAHLHYAPTGLGNRAGLLPGLDWRGNGGYVVMPPSRHASGGAYHWAVPPGPLPEVGPLLMAALRPPAPPPRAAVIPRPVGDRYLRAAVEGELGRVLSAPVGGRNDALNMAGFSLGTLVGAGLLHEDLARDVLTEAGSAVGLSAREVGATVTSSLRAGRQHPRKVAS